MVLERQKNYTPEEILTHPSDTLNKQDRQKLYEAQKVAQLSCVLNTVQNGIEDISISLGEQHDTIPDVKVVVNQEYGTDELDVEVVSFTPYSEHEGIMRFLNRTKLNPVYAYPDDTLILCSVEIHVENPDRVSKRISEALCAKSQPHKIVMLFENDDEPYIAQVYPEYITMSNLVETDDIMI